MASNEPNPLIESVIAASGLSPVFARGAIARALTRAGLDPNTLSRRDIKRALPAISAALKVFLPEGELATRMQEIERLAA